MRQLLVLATAALIAVATPVIAAEKPAAAPAAAATTAADKTMTIEDCKRDLAACNTEECKVQVRKNPVCKDVM